MRILRIFLLSLTVSMVCAAGDDFEPDNSPEAARPVGDGVLEKGRKLDPIFEEDWYSITVDVPSTLVVEALHRNQDGGKVSISVRNSADEFVRSGDDSVYTDVDPGLYYVRLSNANDEIIADYSISIYAVPHVDDFNEENDTFDTATPLTPRRIVRNQSLTDGDIDWFSVDIEKGVSRPIVAAVTSPIEDVLIVLHNSEGSDLGLGLIDSRFIGDTDLSQLLFRVRPASSLNAVPSYDFVFWYRDGPDPYESDDSPNTANRVPAQGASHQRQARERYHNLHNQSDEDWFVFNVDDLVDNITVRAPRVVGNDPFIEVYDSSASTLLGGPGQASVTINSEGSGQYYARIYGDVDTQPEHVYEFRVDTIPMPRLSQGTLTGYVIRSAKGTLIDGANVALTGSVSTTRTTDSDGVYAFEALPQGNYSMQVSAEGFISNMRSVNVGSTVTTASFTLDPMEPEDPNDINGDGLVNAVDIQSIINAVLGSGPFADVNNDGTANSVDIQLVINTVLGL